MNKVVVFDLDDTLYKEIDFLKSAYHAIATYVAGDVDSKLVFDKMMTWYIQNENVFQQVISNFSQKEDVTHLLGIYRNHFPEISLSSDIEMVLENLYQVATLGIITDGRSVSQRNKIEALGLGRYFCNDNILISEETGYSKPSEQPFRFFMDKYPGSDYFYVGDNTEKDFIAPNRLGWSTICLKDNGKNIHKQHFDQQTDKSPQQIVKSLSEIGNYL